MPVPTDSELEYIVNGPSLADRLIELWLRPIRPVLPVIQDTKDKPVGEFTMHEIACWALTFGYAATTVIIAQSVASGLIRAAFRGR